MLSFSLSIVLVTSILTSTWAKEVVFVSLGDEVELKCEGEDLTWKVKSNATSMEYIDVLEEDTIEIEENVLTLTKLVHDQVGFYACYNSDGDLINEFKVDIQYKIKKMLPSVSVNKGENTSPGSMACTTVGDHKVIFKWYTRPEGSEENSELTQICGVEGDNCNTEILNNDPQLSEVKEDVVTTPAPFLERLSITTTTESTGYTSEIRITNVQASDRAVYVCRAIAEESKNDDELICSESDNCEEVYTLLRVKDPLGALWPFIGIVAEVVILCLVIFVCEKKSKDDGKDDMDEDGYATDNNISSNNSLRQRK